MVAMGQKRIVYKEGNVVRGSSFPPKMARGTARESMQSASYLRPNKLEKRMRIMQRPAKSMHHLTCLGSRDPGNAGGIPRIVQLLYHTILPMLALRFPRTGMI